MSLALRMPIEPGLDWDAAVAAVVAQRHTAVLLDFRGAGGVPGALTGAVASAAADRFHRQGVDIAGLLVAAPLAAGGPAALAPVTAAIRLADPFGIDRVIIAAAPGDDWTTILEPLEALLAAADEAEVGLSLVVGPGEAVSDPDTAEVLLEALRQTDPEPDAIGLAVDLLAVAEASGLGTAELLGRLGEALEVVCFGPAAAGRVGAELVEQLLAEAPEAVMVVDAATPAAIRAVLAPWQ